MTKLPFDLQQNNVNKYWVLIKENALLNQNWEPYNETFYQITCNDFLPPCHKKNPELDVEQ